MGFSQGSQNKKDLNVELNLLPIFDVLSVCICFLLMTVVWVEVRALETKQAIGSQNKSENIKGSSLWLSIDANNNLTAIIKNEKGLETKKLIPAKKGVIDFQYAETIYAFAAKQNANSTHILPAKNTKYDQVIRLMDLAKKVGINNIGLSPI